MCCGRAEHELQDILTLYLCTTRCHGWSSDTLPTHLAIGVGKVALYGDLSIDGFADPATARVMQHWLLLQWGVADAAYARL